jgi:hypothetical protein
MITQKRLSWHENGWRVRVQSNKTRIHVGFFQTINDAKKARDKALKLYHGEFSSI